MSIKNFFKKHKDSFKTAAIATGVFLAVYGLSYYFTSWDTRPVFEKATPRSASFAGSIEVDDQSLAATHGIALADYGVWAGKNGLSGQNARLNIDSDADGLKNYLEYLHGTDPKKTDTDGDGFGDQQEIVNGYDPAAPAEARPAVEISISKIGVSAPMVWSKSENEKDQLADLQNGVAHFSKTASPGQTGNMIVSGHSSNYIWAKGKYNYIFKNLNNLMPGDIVEVKTVQQNGKNFLYRYKISEKFTTVPSDSRIFEDAAEPILTLSTCWPLGSNSRRLIVKAEIMR